MKAITKQDLLDDVTYIFNTYHNTTREFYLAHGKYSRAPIKRLFGGWNQMLRELDYSLNMRKSNDIKEDEILNEMKSIYKEYGYLTAELQRKVSTYSQSTIEKVFGSFNNMLKKLNLPPNGSGVRYSKKEIIDSLINIYNQYGYISCDLIEQECKFSLQTLYYKFDSLYEACKEANIPYEYEESISKLARRFEIIINNELNSKPVYENTFSWLRNDRTNRPLRIDLFYPDYNLAIEIDGQQHYEDVDMFYKNSQFPLSHNLKERQRLDKLKEQLIKEHNIKFLRLTYQDGKKSTIKKLNQIINS